MGFRVRTVKGLAILLCLGCLVAACGDTPLAGLGDRSSGWIDEVRGPTTVTTTPVGPASPRLTSLSRVDWWNLDLAPASLPAADVALSAVVLRRSGSDRYVQASPFEVAAVLPGLQFPSELPDEIVSITSQLVLASDANTLDNSQVAAFGLWTIEPYTQSRAMGQAGTLFVFRSTGGGGCGDDPACDELLAGGVRAQQRVADGAVSVTWSLESFTYELSVRDDLSDLVVEMLTSLAPLDVLLVDQQEPDQGQATGASDSTTVGG